MYWQQQAGCYTKEEFVRHLLQWCERYDWATDVPHQPPISSVLYTDTSVVPANTGRLDEFVSMFDLATDADRALVKAFALTPYWGGPPGC